MTEPVGFTFVYLIAALMLMGNLGLIFYIIVTRRTPSRQSTAGAPDPGEGGEEADTDEGLAAVGSDIIQQILRAYNVGQLKTLLVRMGQKGHSRDRREQLLSAIDQWLSRPINSGISLRQAGCLLALRRQNDQVPWRAGRDDDLIVSRFQASAAIDELA